MLQKNLSSLLLVSASCLSLVACAAPNSMPTGYTYHKDTYKSAEPPLPAVITQAQRVFMDETQAEQFRDGTYNLLERLTMRAGMPPKPIFVATPYPLTNFYANIDNELRDNMRHVGYALSDTPEGAYVFTYDAVYIGDGTDQEGIANVELALRVFNEIGEEARLLSVEKGRFYIQGAHTLNISPNEFAKYPTEENIYSKRDALYRLDEKIDERTADFKDFNGE
ncbi:MAG: hypothetical protein AAF549_03000 [Pseudomonadota bacterium]